VADERLYPNELSIPFDASLRHWKRYMTALELLGKYGIEERWLDFGCGCGYGTHFLSNFCDDITGVDIFRDAIRYAKKIYSKENILFTTHESGLYDVIFNIEMIEHLKEDEAKQFLCLIREKLKPEGRFICSTPIVNETNTNPINPFHKIEYSYDHFMDLMKEFTLEKYHSEWVTFTDGETKKQGYFCLRAKYETI
jgi:2-polyprenyl-3-methyl-5-hydroxy-6-metoxy-1,4-benzoquinol methylase